MSLRWFLVVFVSLATGCASTVIGAADEHDGAVFADASTDTFVRDASRSDASGDVAAPFQNIVRLGVGSNGACAVTADGGLWCWGTPAWGRDAGTSDPTYAAQIDDAHNVADVSPFLEQSMLLMRDGTVSGWGFSHHGQLGEAIAPNQTSDAVLSLPGVHDIVKLASGHHHVCAVTNTHQVECWGGPYSPSLGVPGTRQTQAPLLIPGLDDVIDVAAAAENVCVVRANGETWCWGSILGPRGATAFDVPTRMDGITDAMQVAAGWDHACVLRRGGTVSCWGSNATGQLGDGTTVTRSTPLDVPGLTNVAQVTAGYGLTCALRTDGTVACWGLYTGLGVPATPYSYVNVTGIGRSIQVTSGTWQSCSLNDASEVFCWGRTGATTGNGDSAPRRIQWLPQ